MDATELQLRRKISDLEEKIDRLNMTLYTLIAWMVGSANSPISTTEADKLFNMMKEMTKMRYYCWECKKSVTSELPDDSVIRAVLVCPECIDAKRVVFPNDEPVQLSFDFEKQVD